MRAAIIVGSVCALLIYPSISKSDDLDRPGVGYWCYSPIRSPTSAEKIAFVEDVSPAAVAAERRWGVPAPILAAMTIVESGYGLTRIAIKSNNVLAFKWPGDKIAAGRQKFELWCQPAEDKGNIYPAFASRADAIDFVASRLKRSPYYEQATATYKTDLKNKMDRKTAARKWLRAIASVYNWKPEEYIPTVGRMADDPIGDGSRTLWSLEP